MKLLSAIKQFFFRLFKRPDVVVHEPAPKPPKVTEPELPETEKPQQEYDFHAWTKAATDISQRFEGDDPWANITGDFDGAALTCGALGWTFKWTNQQPLVKEFVKREGESAARLLMPKTWSEYWAACNSSESVGMRIVSRWSGGSYRVKEPYKSELRAFWKHPTMVEIQVEQAEKVMGAFAQRQTQLVEKHLKQDPEFFWFAFWFDQAVQNGTGKLVRFEDADNLSVSTVLAWCSTAGGTGAADCRKNAKLWQSRKLTDDEAFILKLGYLRARNSRSQYQSDVMNRRGTIAFGSGHVHGKLFKLR